jgi:hypothetical protein
VRCGSEVVNLFLDLPVERPVLLARLNGSHLPLEVADAGSRCFCGFGDGFGSSILGDAMEILEKSDDSSTHIKKIAVDEWC